MPSNRDLLHSYVRGLLRLSRAEWVGMYVPSFDTRTPGHFYVAGDEPGLPEFAGPEIAEAALSSFPTAGFADELRTDIAERSEEPCGVLLTLQDIEPDLEVPLGLPRALLGLRFAEASEDPLHPLLVSDRQLQQLEAIPATVRWSWLLSVGRALAASTAEGDATLLDPLAGIANRSAFQASLAQELAASQRTPRERPVSLMLFNPDSFFEINRQHGHSTGDAIASEIGGRLTSLMSGTEKCCRFGGMIFGILLPNQSEKSAHIRAEEILGHLRNQPFLEAEISLDFSAGLASIDPNQESIEDQSFDLVRRADESLQAAKTGGGGRVVCWNCDLADGPFDRLSGIFTGNTARDYRNMRLLWDTISAISAEQPFSEMARSVLESVQRTFATTYVALAALDEEPQIDLLASVVAQREDDRPTALHPCAVELIEACRGEGVVEGATRADQRPALAIRLGNSSEPLGALYLETSTSLLQRADILFLQGLAGQLRLAMGQRRAAEEQQRQEQAKRKHLESELEQMRSALQRARISYQSPEMMRLVEKVRRAAPVDATVLITGASGTGKELLARTVHELSPRRENPMVVVDCGAISSSLIESELFGHERGAYTGAQRRRDGQIAAADGGTLFLDEIGELPLEVQSKLLRFVQERQYQPVGTNHPKSVDVRIIAATNRDLEEEVESGTFREDLFYRLNVIRLHLPSLSERRGDAHHLAERFRQQFADQYDKHVTGFDAGAWAAIEQFDWPGNIRELQNRVLQAVVLAEGELLTAEDLGLQGIAMPSPAVASLPGPVADNGHGWATTQIAVNGTPSPVRLAQAEQQPGVEERLANALEAIVAGTEGDPPIGRWLRHDLLQAALRLEDGTFQYRARRVGLATSTFRRRLQRVDNGQRPEGWDRITQLLDELLASRQVVPVEDVEDLLIQLILDRYPKKTSKAALLLDVSPPTFRTRAAKMRERTRHDSRS